MGGEFIKEAEGGSVVDYHFFIVSDKGECQLPGNFYGMKTYSS